jgi:chromosome segregation protein
VHIVKLRLIGFKSFVEPTELLIERGLTGVVGPNGCGKSNLLEALRWTMGETSYKSMRAASMDDVIFNGTTTRPARTMAEVTLTVDNAARTAPAEFNGHDVLEITRRIEREMGSTYRVNGREVRARDVKILFDDAATGARSPALVRQGQIGEIVNAKPEQRRRILEDAAGIAGLHTRRHEAELRLRAAEANLARVKDVLDQLTGQLDSLKRQARQARRYKDLSADIRRGEALLLHAHWIAIEADVATAEAERIQALEAAGSAELREAALVAAEHDAATALPERRKVDAERAAAQQRIKLELEACERDIARATARRRELDERASQFRRDLEREDSLVQEATATIAALTKDRAALDAADAATEADRSKAAAALAETERTAAAMEQRLAGLQMAAAEARARRSTRQRQLAEAAALVDRLAGEVAALATSAEMVHEADTLPDELRAAQAAAAALTTRLADLDAAILTAEAARDDASVSAREARTSATSAMLADQRLETEIATLDKLLPDDAGSAGAIALLDAVVVDPGYERALAAALGDDLRASEDATGARHWRLIAPSADDPALPAGVTPLASHMQAPSVLARRLAQVGVVAANDGARLQQSLRTGQRLVSRDGDLWRWDGFVASAGASAAAQRLTERQRLATLREERVATGRAAEHASATDRRAAEGLAAAEASVRRLQSEHRDVRTALDAARASVAMLEAQARERDAGVRRRRDAHDAAVAALADARARHDEAFMALETLTEAEVFDDPLATALDEAAEKRARVAEAKAALVALERAVSERSARRSRIDEDLTVWSARRTDAAERVETIQHRIAATEDDRDTAEADPAALEARRQTLLDLAIDADAARAAAADALAAADIAFREAQADLRAAQVEMARVREANVRAEARVEVARQRRMDHVRLTQERLGVLPAACLALSEHPAEMPLPTLADLDAALVRAKAERDRLGDVNLTAEDALTEAQARVDAMDVERADVETAIAKLRGAIADLNADAKGRLEAAFRQVDAHFQRLFGVLFGGGEARLEMIEAPDDPLQGGLEIVAKPPGKKPATLSLLSGGEQTLTALSLIFAVFLTNPAPICVLDEVDAPLDDSNVDRFCTLMERMAADTDTRFLVITHHPLTMARMHRLFGVTMAERGVSQLVSVDLEAAQGFLDSAAA